jgi:hypothetical protein
MKTLYKISFSLLIFMFIAFFLGQDIVNGSIYEKVKIENTANIAGSLTSCSPECSNEEDVTFFLQAYSDQIITHECQNLSLRAFSLPPVVCYPIWLPPENS